MPIQDQLEIIKAGGEIEFYNLDPGKGITNIGRHPENDLVIDSPGVAPFHAVLDHRQKPYQLVVLSHEGQTVLGEQVLPTNVSTPLQNWDHIQLDGHTIILIEEGGQVIPATLPPGETVSVAPRRAMPVSVSPPTTQPEKPAAPRRAFRAYTSLPPRSGR